MKWLGLLLIFAACSGYGLLLDYRKKMRLREIENFIFVFELLRAEIDYGLTPIGEACLNVAEGAMPQVAAIFRDFEKGMSQRECAELGVLWRQSLDRNWNQFHLEAGEHQILEQFGIAVGYLDKGLQKKNIDMVLSRLGHLKEQATEQFERTSRLYTTVGMLVGAGVVILLI